MSTARIDVRRPAFERLEGRTLLSTASPAADTTPPTVVSVDHVDLPLQEITVRFSEWVGPSIGVGDLRLTDLATGRPVEPMYNVFRSTHPPTPSSATWQVIGRLPAGRYRGTIPAGSVSDESGNALAQDYHFEFTTKAAVVGQNPFYNNSVFDGNSAAADADDARAQPERKWCLGPGQQASENNVSNYSKGINGLLIRMAGLSGGRTPGPADMTFAVATGRDPTGWAAAPAPSGFMVEHVPNFYGDTDLIHLVWPDGAIRNAWLRVTVIANENTQLAEDNVFYFGNLVGETFDTPGVYRVDATDLWRVRNSYSRAQYSQSMSSRVDPTHDTRVNSLDLAAIRMTLGRGIASSPPQGAAVATMAAVVPAPDSGEARPLADHWVAEEVIERRQPQRRDTIL